MFVAGTTSGLARSGTFKGIQTPALLGLTRAGAIPYLTPDMFDKMPSLKGVSVTFSDVYQWTKTMAKTGHSLKTFINVSDSKVFLQTRDPSVFPVRVILCKISHHSSRFCSACSTSVASGALKCYHKTMYACVHGKIISTGSTKQ
jgi:hypothetical protein